MPTATVTDDHAARLAEELPPNEKAYQIYTVHVRWSQAARTNRALRPCEQEGLPPGRMWNSLHIYHMPVEPESLHEIAQYRRAQWWPEYIVDHKPQIVDPSEPTINVKLHLCETWCMGWFSHWTHDVGLSDADVLASFARYVDRIQWLNRQLGEYREYSEGKGRYWHEPYCLMGADDRGRWHGAVDGTEVTDPPCRCTCCRERGIVRIGH